MRVLAIAWIAVAGLALAAHAARTGTPALAAVGLVLSALWILAGLRTTSRATGFLTGIVILAAVSASSGDGFLLPSVAVTAALYGWDASLAAARLAGFSLDGRRQIGRRYGVTSAVLAAASVGLVGGASVLRVRLSFGAAVALSVALLALTTAIALLSRPGSTKPLSQAAAPSEFANEEVGRHLSPDPEPSSD